MSNPCIKGSVFLRVVEDIDRLIREERLSRKEIDSKLDEEVASVLDEDIQPALWYPVESYRVLSELLMEVEGGGRLDYMFERGARTAEHLLDAGLYQQLRYASDKIASDDRAQVQSAGRLIVTISPAMFNFTKWSFHVDPETAKRFMIQVDEAREFPEVLRYASAGFCHAVSERACKAKLITRHERVRPDQILITHEFAKR